jgi:hypothetical protein
VINEFKESNFTPLLVTVSLTLVLHRVLDGTFRFILLGEHSHNLNVIEANKISAKLTVPNDPQPSILTI